LGQIKLQLATIREELDKANRDNPERKHYIDEDPEECTYAKLKLEVFHDPETKDHFPVLPFSTWTQEGIKYMIDYDIAFTVRNCDIATD
jgi:hypothetical protein